MAYDKLLVLIFGAKKLMTRHFSGTIIIGAGPTGLMAADVLSKAGHAVCIYESMPTPGRKFLMAGRGGLNITHSEALLPFVSRYGKSSTHLTPLLEKFGPKQVVAWMNSLDQPHFKGSSGRIFPTAMKAAPLLRAWLSQLNQQGVELKTRHRWLGWNEKQALCIQSEERTELLTADHIILATGGGSWRKLGSDGQWVDFLKSQQVAVNALTPSNCGFNCHWSDYLKYHYAGTPLKSVNLKVGSTQQKGDLMVTQHGLEGGLIYAFSAPLREKILAAGTAEVFLDLMPDLSVEQLQQRLLKPRGRNSLSNHLRKAGIVPVKIALIKEMHPSISNQNLSSWVDALKHCSITLTGMRPIDEAISTAGGVDFNELDAHFMLKKIPETYCAGEMLDWDAPTGGYLLTACLSIGAHIAQAILDSRKAG